MPQTSCGPMTGWPQITPQPFFKLALYLTKQNSVSRHTETLFCQSPDDNLTHNNCIEHFGFSLSNTCHIIWRHEPSHHPRSHLVAANITVRKHGGFINPRVSERTSMIRAHAAWRSTWLSAIQLPTRGNTHFVNNTHTCYLGSAVGMELQDDVCCNVSSRCVRNIYNYNTIRTSKIVALSVQSLFLLLLNIYLIAVWVTKCIFWRLCWTSQQ